MKIRIKVSKFIEWEIVKKKNFFLRKIVKKKVYFGNFQVGKFVKKGLIEFFHIFSMLGKIWFFLL
jgi:hypothetical protein